jgi:chromosome segregation protein
MALSELAKVRERMTEESVHIEELNVRLTQLEKQKEQAVLYRSLQDELKRLGSCRSAARLAARKKDQDVLLLSISEENNRVVQVDADISWKTHERDNTRDEIAKIDEEIASRTGSDYMALVSRGKSCNRWLSPFYRSCRKRQGRGRP